MRHTFALAFLVCLQGCFAPPGCDEENQTHPIVHDLAGLDLAMPPPCTNCDGKCVDLTSDPDNCGACGIVCASGVCETGDGGLPACTCQPGDGGTPGCESPLGPSCLAGGHCGCGGEPGVCDPELASSCGPGGCVCGAQGGCSASDSDHCDTSQTPSCRCGDSPSCDGNLADRCDATKTPSCRCGGSPACAAGSSCCVFDVTGANCCGADKKYCCLDGCCDSPCLFFGFCVGQ